MTPHPLDANAHPSMRQWIALVVLCIGQLVIVVDGTVVNVALPVIEHDLGFSQASLAWVVNAYLVTFGGLLLLAGRLGDLLGRKRVFLAGLGLFTAASVWCGLSDSQSMLIAARFVQGIGAAFSSSMVLGILVTLFPRPVERAKAMTVYALVANIGGSIGLLVGGTLIQLFSWHWIFFINLPVGVLGVSAASILLAADEPAHVRRKVDWLGGLLVVGAPTTAVWGIVHAASDGWTSTTTLGMLLVAVVLALGFFAVEARVAEPLVPLRILRSRQLSAANVVRFFHGVGMSSILFTGALYLQHVLGFSAFGTGLGYMPLNALIGLSSAVLVQRLIRRFGAVRPIVPGFALMALGLALLARAPVHASYLIDVMPALMVIGIGVGLVFLPTVTIAMASAGSGDSGLASGLTNVTLQMGAALGTALAASVSAAVTAHALAHRHGVAAALTTGYHAAYLLGLAGPLFGSLVTLAFLRRSAPVSEEAVELAEAEVVFATE